MMRIILLLLLISSYFAINGKNNNDSGNYIINLTGKSIVLNFYAKNPFTGKKTWVDIVSVPTLILGGKSPDTFFDSINATLLPAPIDMHALTCYQVTFDACNTSASRFTSADNFFKKYKDKTIKGVTVPTPPITDLIAHDYKVELINNQIVVTRLNSCMLIPIPNTKQSNLSQWPSQEDLAIENMSPQEQIDTLQNKNVHLHDDITSLDKEIKEYNKSGSIAKENNRKKMRANKYSQINKNEHRIADLQKIIAAIPTIPLGQTTQVTLLDSDNANITDLETTQNLDNNTMQSSLTSA